MKIELGPEDAANVEEIDTLTLDGVTFQIGDPVVLVHTPSGSRAPGRLGSLYGVGRIRGIHVDTAAFGSQTFPFGQPGDDEAGWYLLPGEG